MLNKEKERQSRNVHGNKGTKDIDNQTQVYRPGLTLQDYLGKMHLLELKSVYFNNSKRRNHMKKRESQNVKA